MAANSLMSLRNPDNKGRIRNDVPVALIWSGNGIDGLSSYFLDSFDHVIHVDEAYCMSGRDKTEWQRLKTMIGHVSPFEQTIFFDADLVFYDGFLMDWAWAKTQNKAVCYFEFNAYSLKSHQYVDPSAHPYTLWCDGKEFAKAYPAKDDVMPVCNSSFVFADGSSESDRFFDTCVKNYDRPKCVTVNWNGGLPDEFAFNAAWAETGIDTMHREHGKFKPFYPMKAFVHTQSLVKDAIKAKTIPKATEDCWGVDMAGHTFPAPIIDHYNHCVLTYARRMGNSAALGFWKWVDKKHWTGTRNHF